MKSKFATLMLIGLVITVIGVLGYLNFSSNQKVNDRNNQQDFNFFKYGYIQSQLRSYQALQSNSWNIADKRDWFDTKLDADWERDSADFVKWQIGGYKN